MRELSHDTSTMKGSSMHYYDKANDGHRYLAGRQKCAVACVHDNDRVRGWGIGASLLLGRGDYYKAGRARRGSLLSSLPLDVVVPRLPVGK